MPSFTVRYRPTPSDEVRSTLEDFARRNGAAVRWTHSEAHGCSYALVSSSGDSSISAELRGVSEGATVFDSAVIALAIRPNVAEALPALQDALAGSGRPAGVLGFESDGTTATVEWNNEVTSAEVILAIVDIELARYGAARVTELLTPLPLEWWTSIAQAGLGAPEIAPDRVLEALIEEHHVAS